MAVNKNFVIKNGLEVNTNVLVAAAAEQQVGVGTTRPYYKLHVGGGEGNRGGIGATDLTISGIATIGVAHSDSGAFRVLGISTFQGDIDLLGSAGLSTVRWDASEDRLEFKDNASVGFGSDNDLTIWHDSTGHPDDQHSYIQKKETVGGGELRIDPKAGERGIVLKSGPNDNSVNLYYDNGNVFQTTPQGVNITGVTTSKRVYVTGISTFLNTVNVSTGATITTAGNAAFAGIVTANGGIHVGTAVTIDAGTGNFAMTGIATIGGNLYVTGDIVYDEITGRNLNITGFSTFADDVLFNSDNDITWDKSESALVFNDNAAIRAGTGSDFSIVHDGANTIFRETGTGGLLFYTNEFLVANAAGTETLLRGDENSAVKLFFDNTSRLETTAIGATVFGDFKTSGVGTFGSFYSVGVSTIATNTTFDSYGLSVSTGATITTLGNAAFAGIVTANGGLRVGNVGTIDSNTGNAQLTGIVTAATGNFTGNVTIGGDLNVTGDITYDEIGGRNLNITGFSTFTDDVVFKGDNYDLQWDKSDDALEFADNAEARFGADNDLRVYHNASHSFLSNSTGYLHLQSDSLSLAAKSAGENYLVANKDGAVELYFDSTERLSTTAIGATVFGDFIASGVGTFANLKVAGIATADRFIGIHTSADGGGIGIGSTSAHVGYGFTYIDFKGPGVSTDYASSVTGITTIYFQGGGGSSVGAAGTWQNDGAQGISTAKSVGINTVGVAVTALQGGEKGASSGIGQTFQGLYISNGMVVNDNQLNGNHYIGTAFGGIMAGPVTVNGVITVDGNWAVV